MTPETEPPAAATPDQPVTQGPSSGLPMPQHDESRLWAGYVPVAVPPPGAPVRITAAGVVTNEVNGNVTIAPTTRLRDVLSGTRVNREEIRSDLSYLKAEEWRLPWEEAIGGVSANGVIIVVAPRGYGSTTFALRLLAEHAPEHAELIRLEVDWSSPAADKLPLEAGRAYQADLKEPRQDRFDGAFLHALGAQSIQLKALGSRLVLAIAEELWLGHREQIPSTVSVVRLGQPPDALRLIEKRLTTGGRHSLIPYVRQPEAAKHVRGQNAVQAVRAVDAVVRQWQEHLRRREPEASIRLAATVTESPGGGKDLDPRLKLAIEQALGDWHDRLDQLFDEPGRGSGNDGPLSPEDRCLLMSLALRQSGTAAEIEAAALSLEQTLGKGHPTGGGEAGNAWSVLARRGLRPRLKDFGADIDGRDGVTFDHPGYAEAVLAYVWENYSGLRDDLISWMIRCASADGQPEDPAITTLTALILRLQDADRLTSVRDKALSLNLSKVIVSVMTAAAADEHMGSQARALLYQWATQRAEVQHIVISVCRELMEKKADAALIRLGRVARSADDAEVRRRVLATFRAAATAPRGAERLAAAVATWQRDRPASADTRLGVLALLAAEAEGISWPSSHLIGVDVVKGLRELLSGRDLAAETVTIVVSWLTASAQDSARYTAALRQLAAAASDRHAFTAGTAVMKELTDVSAPDGDSVGADLYAELFTPRLRSRSAVSRTEI